MNRFRARSRRDILFFEDVAAECVAFYEGIGRKDEAIELGWMWGALTAKNLFPPGTRKLPPVVFHNFVRAAWMYIGVLDWVVMTEEDGIRRLRTENEAITRRIGKNAFMSAVYAGTFSGIFGTRFVCIRSRQTRKHANYEFKDTREPVVIHSKPKDAYNRLNALKFSKGVALGDALRAGMFKLRNGNRLYFRGRPLVVAENTIFHMLGYNGILLAKVPEICFNYFKTLIGKGTSFEEGLVLLKSILQATGWGVIKIERTRRSVAINIKDPPYGMQCEKDNWNFLAGMVLGYLWVFDRDLDFAGLKESAGRVRLNYA